MSTLRDDIRQEIIEAITAGADHMNLPWKYPKPEPDEFTDAIIALLRERLTSDEAIVAAGRVIGNLQTDDYLGPDPTTRYFNDRRKTTRAALTAALDAVLGKQP